MDFHSKLTKPTFSLPFFCISTFSFFSLLILVFSFIHRRHRKTEQRSLNSTSQYSLLESVDTNQPANKSNLTQLTHSLLFEILPSNSLKSETVFKIEACDDPVGNGSVWDRETVDMGGKECEKKKKNKRAKKKSCSPNPKVSDECGEEKCAVKERLGVKGKQELVCLYPFTSSSSAAQRKIKQQYDQLVKSNESNCLTLAQVGQFVNCLIEARNELQHKSEVIQRKFTITKALLFKADRSSFDRLRQQIYKLELEQKRLEENVFVYNCLQQQIKLSPAYKRMIEIGASIELTAKSGEVVKNSDPKFADISFEELLAQEKKDSFWQRNGKLRSCLG